MDFILLFFLGGISSLFIGAIVDALPYFLGWRNEVKYESRWKAGWACFFNPKRINYLYGWPFKSENKINSSKYFIVYICYGIFIACFYKLNHQNDNIITTLIVFSLLLFFSWIDINENLIPAVISLPFFWYGLLWSPYETDIMSRAFGGGIGFFATYFSMLITGFIKKEDLIAGGDICLMTCVGVWAGDKAISICLFITSLVYIAYSLPLRFKGIRYVPMGPAICISLFTYICLSKYFY